MDDRISADKKAPWYEEDEKAASVQEVLLYDKDGPAEFAENAELR